MLSRILMRVIFVFIDTVKQGKCRLILDCPHQMQLLRKESVFKQRLTQFKVEIIDAY